MSWEEHPAWAALGPQWRNCCVQARTGLSLTLVRTRTKVKKGGSSLTEVTPYLPSLGFTQNQGITSHPHIQAFSTVLLASTQAKDRGQC
jgi:hypothetical protein